MATITVGASGGDQTTLAAAIAAASNGDTISILANFVHDNSTVTVNKDDLVIESATDTAADAVISSNLSKTFSLSNDGTDFKNLTITNTYTSTGYALYANKEFTMADCIVSCSHDTLGYGIIHPKDGSKIERTQFAGGQRGIGLATTSQHVTAESCLFFDHNFAGIYSSTGEFTIKNCTVYALNSTLSTPYGIYTGTNGDNVSIYNTVVYARNAGGIDYGIRMKADASNTIKNCIVFGDPITADYDGEEAPTVSADLKDTDDVTTDGNNIFVALGTNFHPDTSGLAYHTGLTAGVSSAGTDLSGSAFADPPSIGCFEALATGYANIVSAVAAASIASVDGVAAASISKVTGVSG